MRVAKLFPLLVLVVVVGAVSCSKNDTSAPVAKINDRVITREQFEKAFTIVDEKYLPENKDLDGMREFLQTLIDKEIMALKADELGYDKDNFVVQGMEAFKKVGLQAGYIKVKVADRINVTEKDLKEAYPFFGVNRRVKQILVDTREEADHVYDILQEGHDFESVCKEYSKGPDAEKGGEVVNALWGTFPPEFQDELFTTKVGDVTHPILSQYGYFLIKVIAETKPNPKPLDEVRSDLEQILKQQQQIKYSFEMSNALREKHGFQFYEDNVGIAFEALPPDRALTNPPDRSTEIYPLLKFTAADLDKPLVEYKNKYITIKDFSDLYDRASFFQRPRRQYRYGDIKKFIVDLVMNELIEEELQTSGIENNPQVKRMLDRKREQLMVDKLYQDLVNDQTQVPYNEVKNYYQDNLEQFRRPEERRFGVVLTGDRASAKEACDMLRSGEGFSAVRATYSIEDEQVYGGDEGKFFTKGETADIDDQGFVLTVCGVSDPFETGRGWMVLKCLEKRPERIISINEAQAQITNYLKTIKNEERLNELLAKWREEYTVEIYDNNLKKVDPNLRRQKPVSFT
jgi:parvulin-like peptidyl-prolyl isomerase